jgi:hypothetical protein
VNATIDQIILSLNKDGLSPADISTILYAKEHVPMSATEIADVIKTAATVAPAVEPAQPEPTPTAVEELPFSLEDSAEPAVVSPEMIQPVDPTPTALTKKEAIQIVKKWATENDEFPMTQEQMVEELQQIDSYRVLQYGFPSSDAFDQFPEIVKKYAPNAKHEVQPVKAESAPAPLIVIGGNAASAKPKEQACPTPADKKDYWKTLRWWPYFSGFDEMEDGGIKMYINNFLPEGTTIISSLPKEGKTWLALSICKALTSGQPLFGKAGFEVTETVPVIYLAAEVGDRPFKQRLRKFGITNDKSKFMCRTLTKGSPNLDSSDLEQAIRTLEPVVILDVLSCFSRSDDEDDSVENQKLRIAIGNLRRAGARAVVILHHATKNFKQKPTKENAVRGSGDILAMVDCVWALMLDDRLYQSSGIEEVDVLGWGRDFSPDAFRFALTRKGTSADGNMYKNGIVSVIDSTHDLGFIDKAVAKADRVRADEETQRDVAAYIDQLIQNNPTITVLELINVSGQSRRTIDRVLRELGWTKPLGRAKKGEINQWTKLAGVARAQRAGSAATEPGLPKLAA